MDRRTHLRHLPLLGVLSALRRSDLHLRHPPKDPARGQIRNHRCGVPHRHLSSRTTERQMDVHPLAFHSHQPALHHHRHRTVRLDLRYGQPQNQVHRRFHAGIPHLPGTVLRHGARQQTIQSINPCPIPPLLQINWPTY